MWQSFAARGAELTGYARAMQTRVVILGAGFGGLELATTLSEALVDDVAVTLIDKNDAFVFGFAKLDVMFGRTTPGAVRMPYREIAKAGLQFLQETVTAIDPDARRVTTDAGVHEADILVIALGADYDMEATPGLAEGANEFYSVAGANALRDVLPAFSGGRVVVGVCGAPFKCPPAPSECALLLHDYFLARGIREACDLKLVMPLGTPVPPSPDTSRALLDAFAERDIEFVGGRRVRSIDAARKVAVLDDDSELPFDLFLGVPKHRAPDVVIASGMTENGYVPVESRTLATSYPGVYAVGDCATVGVPKAGVFAERAARVVAKSVIANLRGEPAPEGYDGRGSCFIEFGRGHIARVDIDFLSGPKPTGTFQPPSAALAAEKEHFGSSRRARWFGG
jgi:sulfide:quinone oxidoreductase